ncbi:MAG: hypothetical protein ACYDCI_15225 [Candidatus Limnocylindrales bacterium]
MVAETVEFIPPPPPIRLHKPGRRGRTDVQRPASCPDGHRGTIRIDPRPREIVGVVDDATHELILLYPAGGKDPESLKEVFATKEGIPSWIVTDWRPIGAEGHSRRVSRTIHYRCEEHLRPDAQRAAGFDRITSVPVLTAIIKAQLSPIHWDALKAAVEQYIPAHNGQKLRNNSAATRSARSLGRASTVDWE